MREMKLRAGGPGEIHVAHLHHGLRGEEADADQHWVAELCEGMRVRFWTERVEIPASDTREGWEAAAREARYKFLTQSAEQIGARFVATAHTADDQIETVLHRILRGTGIDGLTGIPFTRQLSASVTLIRPMLGVTRTEVVTCLEALQQDYCNDSSNQSLEFTRNWIRNELLPSIRERVNPDVDRALLRLAQQAAEQRAEISPQVERRFAECVGFPEHRISIATVSLTNESPFVIRELCRRVWKQAGWPLRDMGFAQWQQLADLIVGNESRVISFPGAIRAEARNGRVFFTRS
jgi:tRNA(Ile)-lysidine synthase